MSVSHRQAALAALLLLLGLSLAGCRLGATDPPPTSSPQPSATSPFTVAPPGPTAGAAPTPGPPAADPDQAGEWRPAGRGIPAQVGVAAVAVAPSDPQVIYLAAYEPGGLYRSGDGGASWTAAGGGLGGLAPVAVDVHPGDPDIAWAGTVAGGFRTADGGLSWQPMPALPQAPIYALAIEDNAQTLYAGGEGIGTWHSQDGGLTWTAGDWPHPETRVLGLAVATDGTAYAGTAGQGVWASHDGGQTWHQAGQLPAQAHVGALATTADGRLYALVGGQLYLSRDQGDRWEPAGPPAFEALSLAIEQGAGSWLYLGSKGDGLAIALAENGTWTQAGEELWHADITCLVADPVTAGHVYLGTRYNGLYHSRDGGRNWSLVTASVGQPVIAALARSPAEPRTLYAGTLDGVYRSRDNGQSWQPVSNALGKVLVQALAVGSDGERVYAGARDGLYISRDGAATWALAGGSQDSASEAALTTAIFALAIDPQDENKTYAGSWGHNVLRSIDGAQTWAPIHHGLETLSVHAFAIDPVAPNNLYAGTVEGIYRSVDAGQSWQPSPVGGRPQSILALVIDPMEPATLYAGTSQGVYRSTDGAQTWQAAGYDSLDMTVTAMALEPSAAGTLYAGTEHHGLFRSDDGGVQWQPWGLAGTSIYAILVDPDGTVWLGTDRGVFRNR